MRVAAIGGHNEDKTNIVRSLVCTNYAFSIYFRGRSSDSASLGIINLDKVCYEGQSICGFSAGVKRDSNRDWGSP